MHKYSMEYLNVHWDDTFPFFDSSKLDIISNTARQADLIKFISDEVQKT